LLWPAFWGPEESPGLTAITIRPLLDLRLARTRPPAEETLQVSVAQGAAHYTQNNVPPSVTSVSLFADRQLQTHR
jgi:hypothetical protein